MVPQSMIATCGIRAASVCFGMVPYFAKILIQAGVAAVAVSCYRYALAASNYRPCSPWVG